MIPFVVLLCLPFILSGCLEGILSKPKVELPSPDGGAGASAPSTAGEAALLREADEAKRAGRVDEAIAKYKEFIRTYPDSDYADSSKAALGQLYEDQGQTDRAILVYQDFLEHHPQSRFAPEVRYRQAALYLNAGRYDEAIDLLTDMLGQTGEPEKQARIRILLGRAYLGKGNRSQSLDLFLKAHGETTDAVDKKEADRGVKATLALMTLDELPLAQTEYAQDYPGGYVTYILAYKLHQAGRIDEAEAELGVFFEKFPKHEMATDARALLEAIQNGSDAPKLTFADDFKLATAVNVDRNPEEDMQHGPLPDYKAMDIACLLPLTESKVSKYGQMVLTGIKLALKTYRPVTKGFRANLVEYDTQGKPELAAQLVQKAADRASVLAMIGPLLSKEASQAAPRAEELGMPMIAISQREGLSRTGENIFRIFLTPRAQAEAVAMYCVQVLGLTRLAILYPNEAYGREMKDYFQAEVKRLGGQIVTIQSYDPKKQEYSAEVEQLSGVGKMLRKVGAGRKVSVPFEAVFIPDSAEKIAMVAPQFAAHDITTIRLLGTSLWHTPRLLSMVARYTQRSVIPTAFFPDMDKPEIKTFVEAFRAEMNDPTAEPTQFEAYGYDAGRLILAMMDRRHVSTREELTKAIDAMGRFRGVTGRFTFDDTGDYKSEPMLITVEGTEFKPVQ